MTGFKFLGAAVVLCGLIATQARAHGIEVPEAAAPLWSAACVADHGPKMCSQPTRVDGARGGHDRGNNAPSPDVDVPYWNGNDDWPANMILG